jgi:hypothetical protein
MLSRRPTSVLLTLLAVLFLTHPSSAIKFSLPAQRYPPAKCIWNAAHVNALVIVTANVGPGANQRIDIEIIDSSPEKNVYLHKRGINGETRLAITAHAEGEVGVCFKNHLDSGVFFCILPKGYGELTCLSVLVDVSLRDGERSRIVDLDVDIGADAVDYKYVSPTACVALNFL